jgi:hypothetical protein
VTRARHLFDLANLCSVSPPDTYGLTVADFGQLISGIRAYRAAQRPAGPQA